MDRAKYDLLQTALLECLKTGQPATWIELLPAVEQSLKKKKHTVQGKLEWNLFWVTLDLVAKHKINKNKSVTPVQYTIERAGN